MHRILGSIRQAARDDAGASMVEVGFQLIAAFVLVGLAFVALSRIAGGGQVPLEQCIEHASCEAAASAHGLK